MKLLLILLGILKWIGIVLLALLLLLLVILLVVMLSPIRYQLVGEKGEALSGSFGVSWLGGAVKCSGSYTPTDSLQMRLKVFWFTLIGGEPKPKKEKKTRKQKKEKQNKTEQTPQKQELEPDIVAAEKTEAPKADPTGTEIPKAEQKPVEIQEQKPKTSAQKMKQQPKTVRRVKLSEIEEKPPVEDAELTAEEEAFFTGEDTEERKEKIPPIVKELWKIEDKKGIFKALQKMLKRLIKGILPGNLFLKGTIGTGDPTTTGYVLAAAGMLTAKFGNDIQIKGDFTQAVVEDMEVRITGKIRLGSLVWAVLAFVLAKPVRKALWRIIKFLRKKD